MLEWIGYFERSKCSKNKKDSGPLPNISQNEKIMNVEQGDSTGHKSDSS